ncbi:MAG: hypothetical protein HC923_03295 [Myxococcales bacterium]|nr:hypothetical protein [Myxococcales bacterium]
MIRGERLNSITHLVGASLALAGLVLLIAFSALSADGWKLGSALTYGIALVLMFLFSTLYHSFRGLTKAVFHRLDHIGIYLLIAGTYTPYCLVVLRDGSGPWIFSIVWAFAIFGITFKSIFGPRYNFVSTATYVASGWLIVFDLQTLQSRLEPLGFALLLLGGALYTMAPCSISGSDSPETTPSGISSSWQQRRLTSSRSCSSSYPELDRILESDGFMIRNKPHLENPRSSFALATGLAGCLALAACEMERPNQVGTEAELGDSPIAEETEDLREAMNDRNAQEIEEMRASAQETEEKLANLRERLARAEAASRTTSCKNVKS